MLKLSNLVILELLLKVRGKLSVESRKCSLCEVDLNPGISINREEHILLIQILSEINVFISTAIKSAKTSFISSCVSVKLKKLPFGASFPFNFLSYGRLIS